MYIGLDTATVLGIAIWLPENCTAKVLEIKGNPLEQLVEIVNMVPMNGECIFVMEKMHYFRNAKTIRSLIERYGYLKYSLENVGYPVKEVSPGVARAHLGVKTKQETFDLFLPYFFGKRFTSNHSDALAVALYQSYLDGCQELNWKKLTVKEVEHGTEALSILRG